MVIGNGTTVVFPEGLRTMSTLSNVYEEVKIFQITELRKSRGDTDDPFGLKRFVSCINIPDKFLVQTKF